MSAPLINKPAIACIGRIKVFVKPVKARTNAAAERGQRHARKGEAILQARRYAHALGDGQL